MESLDSRTASEVLASFVRDRLAESDFFSDLSSSFLAALGIDNPSRIAALPVTDVYAESFLRCYLRADPTGDEALAALAGRELAVPSRNRIIVRALTRNYRVTSGLEFFSPPTDPEVKHFPALWEAFSRDDKADSRKLLEAAWLEIWEHITFWDDAYSAVLTAARPLAANRVMAQSN